MSGNVVILAGGTGGAKFVRGVACCVPPEKLTIIVNTGDDVTIHGLRISPDVDIITYTLAGLVDPVKGWGVADDTFNCLEQLRQYGRAGWFNLGDRDFATHLQRTQLLAEGKTPAEVAQVLATSLGVRQRVLPMTDQAVETHVQLEDGTVLHFQEYLIREGAPENVESILFQNVGQASPAAGVLQAIEEADVILVAPSSPVVSIGTILSVPSLFDAIAASDARAAAVSPLMGGAPVSGPSAQLMRAFGMAINNRALCDAYGPLIQLLVIHETDAGDVPEIEAQGLDALVIDTLMPDLPNSTRVARTVLEALEYPITEVELPALQQFAAPVPEASAHSRVRAPESAEQLDALRGRIAELEAALQVERGTGDAPATTPSGDAAALQERLAAATERIAVVERDRTEKINAARRVVRALRNARSTAEGDLEEARTRIVELQDEVEAAAAQVRTTSEHDPAALTKQVQALEQEREAAQKRIEALQGDIAHLTAEQKAQEERWADSETAVAHARTEAEQQVTALTAQVRELESERDTVQAETATVRDAAQDHIDALQKNIAQLTAGQEELEGALEGAQRSAAEHDAVVVKLEQDMQDQVTVLKEEITAAHVDRDSTRDRTAELEEQVGVQTGMIDELRAEMASGVASAEAEHEEQLKTLEAELALVMASRERARNRRREDRTKARELIRNLREELFKAQELVAESSGEQEVSKDRAERADRMRDEHRARVAQLETQLQNMEAQMDATKAALSASEARVTRLQEELTALAREGRHNLIRPTPAPPPSPTPPPTTGVEGVVLPPNSAGWSPSGDDESMAERARRRGQQPE